MVNVDDITAYEDGEMDEDKQIEFFQRIINDGSVWRLQGSYGRQAMSYLESGLCELGEQRFTDYYGNTVPSKYDVKPGSKGAPLNTR